MRKKISLILGAFLSVFLLVACSSTGTKTAKGDKLKVVVTILLLQI